MLTWPLLPLPHPPYISMHCPLPPNIAARSVVTPIPTQNVLQKVNSAVHAVAITISLHYASREDDARWTNRTCKEASSQDAVLAVIVELHIVPAAPHADTAFRSPNHHSTSRTPSHSPSCSPSHSALLWGSAQSNRHSTPHRYYQDALEVIKADGITTGSQAEGKLYTESASDGQVAFYTQLQLLAWDGTKTMTVKIDPGAQVNTIPFSRYQTLFPRKLT